MWHLLRYCTYILCRLWKLILCCSLSIPQLAQLLNVFFLSLPFLGWKLEGCRLPLQLQNQQEHFQMPSGNRILASCHVLYDISIFSTLPERERQKEKKKNKEKQVQFQHSSNEQRLPVVQNDFVVWWDICLYNITGLSFLWHNPAMWSEGKTVSNGSLCFHPVYIGQIFESIVMGQVLGDLCCLALGLGSVKSRLPLQSLQLLASHFCI